MDLARFSHINTDRLRLIPLTETDPDALVAGLGSFPVARWLARVPYPYTRDDALRLIESQRETPRPVWSVLADGELIGGVWIDKHLGYWLAESAWGKGYATEACRAVLAAHFTDPEAANVGSSYFLGNDTSKQVLAKLGFTDIAPRKLFSQAHGAEVDAQEVRLTREGFEDGPLFTSRTERLRLDALTLDDLPVVHAEWGAPDIARMMGTVTADWTKAQARDWILRSARHRRAGFGLAVRLHDGTLIGSVALGGDPANMGYLFGAKHWGKGYATEAVGALLRCAFRQFDDLTDVEATVFDDNPASARVLQKLGFTAIGPADCQSIARVEPSANTLYRLTRSSLKV